MYLDYESQKRFEAEAAKVGVKDPHLSASAHHNTHTVMLKDGKEPIGAANLSHFPGCCGIAILHDAAADDPKILELLFRVREAMATDTNKGLCVYTDVVGRAPQFLRKLGYRISTRGFFNPNSGNKVSVWVKRIGQEE